MYVEIYLKVCIYYNRKQIITIIDLHCCCHSYRYIVVVMVTDTLREHQERPSGIILVGYCQGPGG